MTAPAPTASSTAQVTIFLNRLPGDQSWSNDDILKPLRAYAEGKLGCKTPLVAHAHQRDDLASGSLVNWGSTVVCADLHDLIPRPSDLTLLEKLVSKGCRVHVVSMGGEINSVLHAILACSRAWTHLESTIAKLRASAADDRAKAAQREQMIASDFALGVIRSGIIAGVREAVAKAYPQEQPNPA